MSVECRAVLSDKIGEGKGMNDDSKLPVAGVSMKGQSIGSE